MQQITLHAKVIKYADDNSHLFLPISLKTDKMTSTDSTSAISCHLPT